jgi:Domain of unknown function (DUF4114)
MSMPYQVDILPGKKVIIEVSFSGILENRVRIVDNDTGEVANGGYFNSRGFFGPKGGTWDSEVNGSVQTKVYKIYSEYNKESTGRSPWADNRAQVTGEAGKNVVVGFDDNGSAGDGDYNDAVAKVAWR